MAEFHSILYYKKIVSLSFILLLSFLFRSDKAYSQSTDPEMISVVFGIQSITPLTINSSTGLIEEVSENDEVCYTLMVNHSEADVSTIEIRMGSTLGANDVSFASYNFNDFTTSSSTTYRKGNEWKYCSPIKNFQEDLFYEISFYNSNGDCTHKGIGQSNN